jgi:hypothetical protein
VTQSNSPGNVDPTTNPHAAVDANYDGLLCVQWLGLHAATTATAVLLPSALTALWCLADGQQLLLVVAGLLGCFLSHQHALACVTWAIVYSADEFVRLSFATTSTDAAVIATSSTDDSTESTACDEFV